MRNSSVFAFLTVELPSYFVAARTFVALGRALFGRRFWGGFSCEPTMSASNSIGYARLHYELLQNRKKGRLCRRP